MTYFYKNFFLFFFLFCFFSGDCLCMSKERKELFEQLQMRPAASSLKMPREKGEIKKRKRRVVSFNDKIDRVGSGWLPLVLAQMYCGDTVEDLRKKDLPEDVIVEAQKIFLDAKTFLDISFFYDFTNAKEETYFEASREEFLEAKRILKRRVYGVISDAFFKKKKESLPDKKIIALARFFFPQVKEVFDSKRFNSKKHHRYILSWARKIEKKVLKQEARQEKRDEEEEGEEEGLGMDPAASVRWRSSLTAKELKKTLGDEEEGSDDDLPEGAAPAIVKSRFRRLFKDACKEVKRLGNLIGCKTVSCVH